MIDMVNDKRDIEYEKTKIKTTKLKRDLGELKEKLKKAVADEKEANIFYKELINLAQRAEQRGTADKLKAILSQEQSHAEMDWRLLKDTEEAERVVSEADRLMKTKRFT